jgi:hypothetical protein
MSKVSNGRQCTCFLPVQTLWQPPRAWHLPKASASARPSSQQPLQHVQMRAPLFSSTTIPVVHSRPQEVTCCRYSPAMCAIVVMVSHGECKSNKMFIA